MKFYFLFPNWPIYQLIENDICDCSGGVFVWASSWVVSFLKFPIWFCGILTVGLSKKIFQNVTKEKPFDITTTKTQYDRCTLLNFVTAAFENNAPCQTNSLYDKLS